MAASGPAEHSPDISPPLKVPKTEVPSPESEDLSDSNQDQSEPSTPNRFSPLNVQGSGVGSRGSAACSSANSNSLTACRGMSWTPSETNALIAVWGNERLTEARMQQLEVAGTVFSGKAPGPAMYERVSRALSELGYERTPSQCRERMKTLRRCYSRVKEHGVGKRKSSYTLEQLEKVFGQGGWDAQSCAPVLINSSGLYQEMESDSSTTLEDFSQEAWCHQVLDSAFQDPDMDTDDLQVPKNRSVLIHNDVLEPMQKKDAMQTVIHILESVHIKWENFQTWTEFSRLHLSNKLAIFGVGYNTRWREDVRYHYAEISSQVPFGKRLREYFNPEKPEGRVIMTKVQKMNWKNVYYKYLDITISEARCLELHMEVDWLHVSQSRLNERRSHYLLPGNLPKTHGLYAIGYEELTPSSDASSTSPWDDGDADGSPRCGSENGGRSHSDGVGTELRERRVTYCYLGISKDRTIQQSLFHHFQGSGKHGVHGEASDVTRFLQENCGIGDLNQRFSVYIKLIEVELDFLSAGSLVECLETAIGYSLKYNNQEAS